MNTLPALALLTFALAPAPYGVALNYLTQECAGYWGGDEYVYYIAPQGWAYYLPDDNREIHTLRGTFTWTGSAEELCSDIGFTYVSDNIGKDKGERVVVTPEFLIEAEAARRDEVELVLAIGMFLAGGAVGCSLCLLLRRR
jgi:hypothetical protein